MALPHTRLREALPRASEVALLCGTRAAASALAYASGFRALSDDDYARISIAQRFAQAPSFDPSHSSWLPAPFWLYGSALRLLGSDLAVARGTAISLSTLATVLVYVAARLLGACRPGALVGAALSALLPYSALLGIAALPEVPCAALILLGAATLANGEPRIRALGGLALSLACLSRYEAWPVAGVFAGITCCDAWRSRGLAVGALLALLGPALWLLVGRAEHGSALFFIARVASYRRALGPSASAPLMLRLLEYPGLLLRAEPELCALLLVVSVAWARIGARDRALPYRRVALSLLALLGFMMLGSVRDGVPTHHAARVLLPLWFFACVVSGHGLAHLVARTSGKARMGLLALSTAALFAGLLARPKLLPSEGFAERQRELSVGSEAKRRGLGPLAIDTSDYGYLAIQAAYGSPTQSAPLDDHDPRRARPSDPFLDGATLGRALDERGAPFLIATTEHRALARTLCGAELWHNAGFALFACRRGAALPAGH